jgi:hypothetical protein
MSKLAGEPVSLLLLVSSTEQTSVTVQQDAGERVLKQHVGYLMADAVTTAHWGVVVVLEDETPTAQGHEGGRERGWAV